MKRHTKKTKKATAKATKTPKTATSMLGIPALEIEDWWVEIEGITPILFHCWDIKVLEEMERKRQKKASGPRPAKELPEILAEKTVYRMKNGKPGFPALAFKKAAVEVCTSIHGITKIAARQSHYVIGDEFHDLHGSLVRIDGPESMFSKPVRIQQTTDLRHRTWVNPWKARLHLAVNKNLLSEEQIANLYNTAGFGVGVGEWRNDKGGELGQFRVISVSIARKKVRHVA